MEGEAGKTIAPLHLLISVNSGESVTRSSGLSRGDVRRGENVEPGDGTSCAV